VTRGTSGDFALQETYCTAQNPLDTDLQDLHGSEEKNYLCSSVFIRVPYSFLIQIQACLALITFYSAAENLITAFRADIAGFLILNPLFSTNLPPIRNSPQYDLFADRHRKLINMLTGKFIAFPYRDSPAAL